MLLPLIWLLVPTKAALGQELTSQQIVLIVTNQELNNPYIVIENNQTSFDKARQVHLAELFMQNGHQVKIGSSSVNRESNLQRNIVMFTSKTSNLTLSGIKESDRALVLQMDCTTSIDLELHAKRIKVNQNIVLMQPCGSFWHLSEAYSVNDIPIIHELGQYFVNRRSGLSFLRNGKVSKDFYERRRDLQGHMMKAVVGLEPPFSVLDGDYKKIFFPNNDTYDVTDYVTKSKGVANEVFAEMVQHFNLTFSAFMRKTLVWGKRTVLDNGTELWSGLVGDLVNNDAEIVVAPLGMWADRSHLIHFLPPLHAPSPAIFIATNPAEAVSWTLMLSPWHPDVWITLTVFASVIAIILTSLEQKGSKASITASL